MYFRHLALAMALCTSTLFTQTKFPMGDGLDKWGVPLKVPETELSLRLGGRFQSLATISEDEDLDAKTEVKNQDFQARRVRFQFQAELGKRALFNMDLRNDGANSGANGGERNFQVGDAYVAIPLSEGSSHSVRLFRAKVDVSRTQTVSSSELLFVNRPYVADEAASFVSQGRRASNAQLIGSFNRKVSYQLVIGDGVGRERFVDAQGDVLGSSGNSGNIQEQNFMVGGKLRLSPVPGWEEPKLTETYFGTGKHFTVGVGAFNTSNIKIVNGAEENTLSRNLLNGELSAHYGEWFFTTEYFKFDGVVENLGAANFNKGSSEGWYAQGEKLFTNFHFLAPFVRYEKWDRFITSGDYASESNLFGVNWYLNGNRFRVTLAYERNHLGRDISGSKERFQAYHLASMWHF